MRSFHKAALVVMLTAGLVACGSPADQPAEEAGTTEAPATAADARPIAFAQCSSCHSVEPGRNGIGPSLAGVFGAKAGHLGETYKYSDALKASGLTWDEATLDRWLTATAKTVPGTKMVYAGQSDAAKRAELIAYLKTLK